MPSIFDKIQAKLELFRLEQRYTRNRHRRSTFMSNAVYVDGEYVYNTPSSTGSSSSTNTSSSTRNNSYKNSRSQPAVPSAEYHHANVSAAAGIAPPSERSTPITSPTSVRFASDDEEDRDYYGGGRRRRSIEHSAPMVQEEAFQATQQRKKLNRFSSMPGFGGSMTSKRTSFAQDWRGNSRVDVREMR